MTNIEFEEALKAVLEKTAFLGSENIQLIETHSRILAKDITSNCDVPFTDNSAMDGYAVRAEDTVEASEKAPVTLRLIGEVTPGTSPAEKIEPGEAVRVMTGSVIPAGADAIVRQELCLAKDGSIEISGPVTKGKDIRLRGEDIAKGDRILEKGTPLTGARMGLLASVGIDPVAVGKRPRVAVLSTGDELIDITDEMLPGKVRASNAYGLAGEIAAAGGILGKPGFARDTVEQFKNALVQAAENADVIITTGAVSVGPYDRLKDALVDAGGEIIFSKIRMRPGSPMTFGKLGNALVFALPGNPAAAMLCFEMFARPALLKMQGSRNLFRMKARATLLQDLKKRPGYLHLVRAKSIHTKTGWETMPLVGQGSGILRSLALSNSLILVQPDEPNLKVGTEVTILMTDWKEEESA